MSARLDELRLRFAQHKAALDRWSEWVPHRPHPKQREFLELSELEALYGGAAGGGKTDAILIGALEDFHQPGYAALLLRRTFPDLKLPKALLDRSHEWLDPTRAEWSEQNRRWTAPRGGVIQFGYCDTAADLQRYKSAEFQYIGIDELTEWPESWYTFLFSRLRRPKGSDIRLRMRGGTNPDGPGYPWIVRRFGIPENDVLRAPIRSGEDRVFLPARAEDNPSLDLTAYEASLAQMAGGRNGVKWKQLRLGIWIPDGAGLVYVFDPRLNTAPELQWRKDRARWTFILGIDYGYTNDCGFVVCGWRAHDPHTYILEAFRVPSLLPSGAAEVVRGLDKEYAFERMVGDIGGLGKGYVEEARQRFTLPITAARKENKRGYIALFNDALASGRIKVSVQTCKDLLAEWEQLPWDTDRKSEMAGFANHAADAALYAWREASSYLEEPAEVKPVPGSPEALAVEERRLEQAVDDELEGDEEHDRDLRRGRFWR